MKQSTTTQGPNMDQRQDISRKLQFLASVLGEAPLLNEAECCGLMMILYEIASDIFPEGCTQASE